jgi:hypothetical protein
MNADTGNAFVRPIVMDTLTQCIRQIVSESGISGLPETQMTQAQRSEYLHGYT